MLIEGFYQIIAGEVNNNEIHTKVRLNKNHVIYKAHFPGSPITPGVCIVQILKDIICREFKKKLVFNNVSNIKYLNIINPLETPEIEYYIKYSEIELGVKTNVQVKANEKVFTKISGIFSEM